MKYIVALNPLESGMHVFGENIYFVVGIMIINFVVTIFNVEYKSHG